VFSSFYWLENPFLQYLFILLVIVYANNFLLLPFFVGNKWYTSYIFVIAFISLAATQLYCYVFAKCGCTLIKCLSDYLWQTIVPLAFLSFIWMLYRYLDKQDEIEKIKQEHTAMELKFLKSQINPHVLFNNLNTIYSYSLEKPNETPELILMLSDHLKHVLYESNSEKIPLSKELHFLENYIKFQKIRTEGVKQINYTVNVDSMNYEIAPLLLITIFENAFKHSKVNSSINIELILTKNQLLCICENDYDNEQVNSNTFSIGLKNFEKRLSLLYPEKYTFTITENDTFKVNLKLELI
jgi:sensor histidine kinase YesM